MASQYISFETDLVKGLTLVILVRLTVKKAESGFFLSKIETGKYQIRRGEEILEEGGMNVSDIGEDIKPIFDKTIDGYIKSLETDVWAEIEEEARYDGGSFNPVEMESIENIVQFRKPA